MGASKEPSAGIRSVMTTIWGDEGARLPFVLSEIESHALGVCTQEMNVICE